MGEVRYRTVDVGGHAVFLREAGEPHRPTVVLLHGFPASSHMFRELIPLLARRYHVLAPDMLGFGYSDAPEFSDFPYTFDALAEVTAELLTALQVPAYALYVHDYGAPIGWRLALRDPGAVQAIVSQSGNAYVAGFFDSYWTRRAMAYGANPSPRSEADVRGAFALEDVRWQYLTGAPDEALVSPDTWHHDVERLSRPGVDQAQLALFRDYSTNVQLYPQVHQYLRDSAVPVLAVWGKGDEIFGVAGAQAFTDDAAEAEVHLIEGGHFLLETAVEDVAALMLDFLERRLAPGIASRPNPTVV